MSTIQIFGVAQSSYVRTARMACAEKGVAHELVPVALGSAEHLAQHPFGKVPAMRDGDVHLYETSAIVHYLDAKVSGGTRLCPADPVVGAEAEQWVSVLNCYVYADFITNYALVYIFAQGEPDRARIDATLPKMDRDLAIIEARLASHDWLAGDAFSIADLFYAPVIGTAKMFPEGGAKIAALPGTSAWLARVAERDSAKQFLYPPR